MPRPAHCATTAGNPEYALQFYNTVFGWKSPKWNGPQDHWLLGISKDPKLGIDGGLSARR